MHRLLHDRLGEDLEEGPRPDRVGVKEEAMKTQIAHRESHVLLPVYSERGEWQLCSVDHVRSDGSPVAHCRWCVTCGDWIPSKHAGDAVIIHPC